MQPSVTSSNPYNITNTSGISQTSTSQPFADLGSIGQDQSAFAVPPSSKKRNWLIGASLGVIGAIAIGLFWFMKKDPDIKLFTELLTRVKNDDKALKELEKILKTAFSDDKISLTRQSGSIHFVVPKEVFKKDFSDRLREVEKQMNDYFKREREKVS